MKEGDDESSSGETNQSGADPQRCSVKQEEHADRKKNGSEAAHDFVTISPAGPATPRPGAKETHGTHEEDDIPRENPEAQARIWVCPTAATEASMGLLRRM